MDKGQFTLDFEKPLRELEDQLQSLRQLSENSNIDASKEISAIEAKIETTMREVYSNLTPWQKVQLARHPKRPYALDYIESIFEDFQELHGDRYFRDDPAVVGGPANFEGAAVMVLGIQKGRNTKENLKRNFGSPHPEGYRKGLRLMKLAQQYKMPVIALIDTPGAYPGIGSEERHVAEAIAVNIREMGTLSVPILSVIIGEGGSGGALGFGVADFLMIFENAYYSVISPEGCAAILWKDRAKAPQAAAALKLDANKLLELGVADAVLQEPLGGAHMDPKTAICTLKEALSKQLKRLQTFSVESLLEKRYQKYRRMGTFAEEASSEPVDQQTQPSEKDAEGTNQPPR